MHTSAPASPCQGAVSHSLRLLPWARRCGTRPCAECLLALPACLQAPAAEPQLLRPGGHRCRGCVRLPLCHGPGKLRLLIRSGSAPESLQPPVPCPAAICCRDAPCRMPVLICALRPPCLQGVLAELQDAGCLEVSRHSRHSRHNKLSMAGTSAGATVAAMGAVLDARSA